MVHKNCGEAIPSYSKEEISAMYKDYEVLRDASDLMDKIREKINNYNFHQSLEDIMAFVDKLNIFVDQQAPWDLKKTNPEKMVEVLYVVLESVRNFSIILIPFIPDSAGKILDNLLVPGAQRSFDYLTKEYALEGGAINKPVGIFPRLG
jgi:methionyl-tRNA synthetase